MITEALLHILQEEHLLNLLSVDSVSDKPSEWAEAALNLQVKNFLKAITSSTPDDTLLTLAEEHLSSIKSELVPDMSIYDRLRYLLLLNGGDEWLMVKGSLTGIQRFIYDVKSESALRNLRGRSYYLTLLLDAVVERILDQFGLTHTSVLYNSGGTFCLFIPYENDTADRFNEIAREISQSVFDYHNEQMVLLNAIHTTRQILETDFGAVMSELQCQKNHDKYTPLRNFDTKLCIKLFSPTTPRERYSAQYIAIGGALPRTECVAICNRPQPNCNCIVEPGGLGLFYHLTTPQEAKKFSGDIRSLIVYNDNSIPIFGDVPIRREYMAGCGARAQSFEDLVGRDTELKRLGVLRMDVDNLGHIFRVIDNGASAVSRYGKMSRRLDIFFKKKLNTIWSERYKNSTVIIYSGGDDLFIAGAWISILQMAQTIQEQFAKAFCDTGTGISGGIVLITERYPIVRAAELSAEEEERAKGFGYHTNTKNSLSVFGMPMRWNIELREVYQTSETLADLINDGNLDKSIVSRLLRYYENVRFRDGQITTPRYIWLISYDLSRLAKRTNNSRGQKFIEQCIKDITTGKTISSNVIDSPYHPLQLLSVAARFAELELRTNNK